MLQPNDPAGAQCGGPGRRCLSVAHTPDAGLLQPTLLSDWQRERRRVGRAAPIRQALRRLLKSIPRTATRPSSRWQAELA